MAKTITSRQQTHSSSCTHVQRAAGWCTARLLSGTQLGKYMQSKSSLGWPVPHGNEMHTGNAGGSNRRKLPQGRGLLPAEKQPQAKCMQACWAGACMQGASLGQGKDARIADQPVLPRLACSHMHMRMHMRRGWAGGRRTGEAQSQLARAGRAAAQARVPKQGQRPTAWRLRPCSPAY